VAILIVPDLIVIVGAYIRVIIDDPEQGVILLRVILLDLILRLLHLQIILGVIFLGVILLLYLID
jgi:hypothetical protein